MERRLAVILAATETFSVMALTLPHDWRGWPIREAS